MGGLWMDEREVTLEQEAETTSGALATEDATVHRGSAQMTRKDDWGQRAEMNGEQAHEAPVMKTDIGLRMQCFAGGPPTGPLPSGQRSDTSSTLPYAEARALDTCIRMMGEMYTDYCHQVVLGAPPGPQRDVPKAPETTRDFEEAAKKLLLAFEVPGTDAEAVYAVLRPFRRDIALLNSLKEAYRTLTGGEELEQRLVKAMSPGDISYALELLGVQSRWTSVVGAAEAGRLFEEMTNLTFRTAGGDVRVPFESSATGCWARAQAMAERLMQLGYSTENVFVAGQLAIESLYGQDQPGKQGYLTPLVAWGYHVAPVLRVRDVSGRVIEMVLDPSTSSSPVPLNQWLEDLTHLTVGGSGARVQIQEVTPAEAIRREGFAQETLEVGQIFYWKTDPRVALPPSPQFPAPVREQAQRPEEWTHELEMRAVEVPLFKLAETIRLQLRHGSINIAAILALIKPLNPFLRARFKDPNDSAGFPMLVETFKGINPTAGKAIQDALDAPGLAADVPFFALATTIQKELNRRPTIDVAVILKAITQLNRPMRERFQNLDISIGFAWLLRWLKTEISQKDGERIQTALDAP